MNSKLKWVVFFVVVITGCVKNIQNDIITSYAEFNELAYFEDCIFSRAIQTHVDSTGKSNLFLTLSAHPIYGLNKDLKFHYIVESVNESGDSGELFEDLFNVGIQEPLTRAYILDSYDGVNHYKITITDLQQNYSESIEVPVKRINNLSEGTKFSSVKLYSVNSKEAELWLSYFLPYENSDSIRVSFSSFTTLNQGSSAKIKLKKFRSDTLHSRPLHSRQIVASSASYFGVDNYKFENVVSEQISITNGFQSHDIFFPRPNSGSYIVELIEDSSGVDEVIDYYKFNIYSRKFPSLKDYNNLIEPFVYILPEKTYEEIVASNEQDGMSLLYSYFLEQAGQKEKALKIIEEYLISVNEANHMFTNFKEGWKTDQGMMYIVFGKPWFETKNYNTVTWSYTHDTSDIDRNFLFTKVRLKSEYFNYHHYILERSKDRFPIYYQRVQDWRTGVIFDFPTF